jgi:HEAT repeat protein
MSDDFSTEDFIWQLKNSKDPDERLFAAFKLGRERDSTVIKPLIEASNDPEMDVRVRVAEALGTRTETEVVPALIKLMQDTAPSVRCTAAISLGHVGDIRAVPSLCTALQDEDDTVRSHAAEALGEFHRDESSHALVAAFIHDPDSNVHYFAKQSLSKVGQTTLEALLDALHHNNDPGLLIDICEILGTLADERSISALQTLLVHEDEAVSEMASWALKRIED